MASMWHWVSFWGSILRAVHETDSEGYDKEVGLGYVKNIWRYRSSLESESRQVRMGSCVSSGKQEHVEQKEVNNLDSLWVFFFFF
jgi:hypothetical protein